MKKGMTLTKKIILNILVHTLWTWIMLFIYAMYENVGGFWYDLGDVNTVIMALIMAAVINTLAILIYRMRPRSNRRQTCIYWCFSGVQTVLYFLFMTGNDIVTDMVYGLITFLIS